MGGGPGGARGKVSRPPPPCPPPPRSHLTLSFTNFCPFSVMRLRDLPNPQVYSRQERYQARPPRVVEPSGFHNENSLAVYQGLVYYLLCLHSEYHKVDAWRGPGVVRGGVRRLRKQGLRGSRTAVEAGTAWGSLRLRGQGERASRASEKRL